MTSTEFFELFFTDPQVSKVCPFSLRSIHCAIVILQDEVVNVTHGQNDIQIAARLVILVLESQIENEAVELKVIRWNLIVPAVCKP